MMGLLYSSIALPICFLLYKMLIALKKKYWDAQDQDNKDSELEIALINQVNDQQEDKQANEWSSSATLKYSVI